MASRISGAGLGHVGLNALLSAPTENRFCLHLQYLALITGESDFLLRRLQIHFLIDFPEHTGPELPLLRRSSSWLCIVFDP